MEAKKKELLRKIWEKTKQTIKVVESMSNTIKAWNTQWKILFWQQFIFAALKPINFSFTLHSRMQRAKTPPYDFINAHDLIIFKRVSDMHLVNLLVCLWRWEFFPRILLINWVWQASYASIDNIEWMWPF